MAGEPGVSIIFSTNVLGIIGNCIKGTKVVVRRTLMRAIFLCCTHAEVVLSSLSPDREGDKSGESLIQKLAAAGI